MELLCESVGDVMVVVLAGAQLDAATAEEFKRDITPVLEAHTQVVFDQEKPDNWLASGTPWEIERIDEACLIPVYGRIEHALDRDGQYNRMWMDWKILLGVPHDLPIVGYGGQTVNYLRLYSA